MVNTFVEANEQCHLKEIRTKANQIGVEEWYEKIVDWLRRLDADEDYLSGGWYLTDNDFLSKMSSLALQGYVDDKGNSRVEGAKLEELEKLEGLIKCLIDDVFEEGCCKEIDHIFGESEPAMTDERRTTLANEFTLQLQAAYQKAVNECNYKATVFWQMVGEYGGVGACKKLLATDQPSDGFYTLWRCDRLDLTFEATIWDNHQWQSLFTQEEIAEAHRRLNELGYFK